MSLDRFRINGTREELEILGARHLVTDPFVNGKGIVRINYMVYESPDKRDLFIWKKTADSKVYQLHHEAKITRTYSVPFRKKS